MASSSDRIGTGQDHILARPGEAVAGGARPPDHVELPTVLDFHVTPRSMEVWHEDDHPVDAARIELQGAEARLTRFLA